MHTIFSHQQKSPATGVSSRERGDQSINARHNELNIADGGEFLDDAIRMKDQPLLETQKKEVFNLFPDAYYPINF